MPKPKELYEHILANIKKLACSRSEPPNFKEITQLVDYLETISHEALSQVDILQDIEFAEDDIPDPDSDGPEGESR